MLLVRKIAVFLGVFALLFIVSSGPATAAADPSVTVSDQVTMDSTVVIDKIVAVQDGWIVIHAGDKSGTVIGWAPVKAGENDKVEVAIDLSKGTPTISAMLHVDAGKVGTYEFPGADVPVKNAAGDVVNTPFKIIGVDVDDQFVKDTKTVSIGAIVAQQDGWIVIHAGDKGGTVLGHTAIKAGLNTVDHVRAEDQKLADDGTFTVPYVLATVDGWIVIHSTAEGGPVLGHAAVKAGLNQGVKVKIDDPKGITDQVSAMLHIDAGTKGTYEFPGADAPVKDSGGKLVNPLFSTTGVAIPDMSATMAPMGDMAATAAPTAK